jgi:hypothetical protein
VTCYGRSRLNQILCSPVRKKRNLGLLGAWGAAMPIYRLLEREALQPELVALMAGVFEDVLQTLGLVDREDPLTKMIARKVIELAQSGERDHARMKQLTLQAFNGKPPASSTA